VKVRVQDVAQLTFAELLERGANLIGKRRELVINDQDAVSADANADVAARAFEHVDIACDLCGFDFDFRQIVLRLRKRCGQAKDERKREQWITLHKLAS